MTEEITEIITKPSRLKRLLQVQQKPGLRWDRPLKLGRFSIQGGLNIEGTSRETFSNHSAF